MSGVFYPQKALISSISQGQTTTVTFTADCDFTPGEIISFRINKQNGMTELNNVSARVVSNTADTITVDIDSTYFTTFVFTPAYEGNGPAMVVPSASGIVPNSFPVGTNLQDAFDQLPPS